MRNLHNIESRKGRSGFNAHPYIGWSGKRGTKYYISRADAGGWRAAPALALNSDEPPYFYGATLAAISEQLASF